jgi:hypothetical protein
LDQNGWSAGCLRFEFRITLNPAAADDKTFVARDDSPTVLIRLHACHDRRFHLHATQVFAGKFHGLRLWVSVEVFDLKHKTAGSHQIDIPLFALSD